MVLDASRDELLQRVWEGGRIDAAAALDLYGVPLAELGAVAAGSYHHSTRASR